MHNWQPANAESPPPPPYVERGVDEQCTECFKGRVSCPTTVGVSKGEEENIRAMIPYLTTTSMRLSFAMPHAGCEL